MNKNIEELKGKWLASNLDYTLDTMLKILEDFEKRLKTIEAEKKTITIEKDLLLDVAKQINKCFREWIEKHLVLDLPMTPDKLAMLSASIIEGIENSIKNIKEGD